MSFINFFKYNRIRDPSIRLNDLDPENNINTDEVDRRRRRQSDDDLEDRTLARQFRVCCGRCCGACGTCCAKCSLAVVITSNVAISAAILIILLFLLISVRSIANQMKTQSEGNDYGQKCFENLGCFPKLYGCVIPTVTVPLPPEKLGVTFHVFANSTHDKLDDKLDDKHIEMTEFNPSLDTKIIIHGFKNGFTEINWMGKLKNLILTKGKGKHNVIVVDWSKGANTGKYWKAAASTNVVGAIVAKFINKLIEIKNADITRFHIIGHSLGAHISGVVGYHFPFPKIARITGLDPAGPCFFKFITVNRDESEYLDMSDASVVQTIHTNGADLGFISKKTLSHYEFYPNGGKRQPGCHSVLDIKTSIHDDSAFAPTLSCSHGYAHDLIIFDYQQYGGCEPVAYSCDSWDAYNNGHCNYDCTYDQCQRMAIGLQYSDHDFKVVVPNKPMKLYVKTSEKEPFCYFRYMVLIKMSDTSDFGDGSINLEIFGDTIRTVNLKDKFYRGQEYKSELTYSAKSSNSLGVIRNVKISFNEINSLSYTIVIEKIFIKYLSSTKMTYDYMCRPELPQKIGGQSISIGCKNVY